MGLNQRKAYPNRFKTKVRFLEKNHKPFVPELLIKKFDRTKQNRSEYLLLVGRRVLCRNKNHYLFKDYFPPLFPSSVRTHTLILVLYHPRRRENPKPPDSASANLSPMESEAQAFVYDALPPLSLSDTNQSPPTLDESHNYSVFRNEISDLTETTAPVESETVDFFSLDVDADAGENENGDEFVTPVVAASKKSRKRRKEKEAEEPRLETNWFNEKSCSKIPMLQLHKG